MTKEILGSGEIIYAALESGQRTVPHGALAGLPLHVPRENPEWTLPETYGHISNTFADDDEIRACVEAAFAETQQSGALYVPDEIFDLYYEKAKTATPGEPEVVSRAAFEASYVIKGLSYLLPYQQQRVIEQNNARAIMGSYRHDDLNGYFRSVLRDNFMPLGIPELYYLFDKIENKFVSRRDTSGIGTMAFVDEADRLVTQIMNARWSTIALPAGSDSSEQSTAHTTTIPDHEEAMLSGNDVASAHEKLVADIGSERILAWGIGSTLQGLGGYVMGRATFSGQDNPFNELRDELIERIKSARSAEEKVAIRGLLKELQALGHMQSQFNKSK